MKALIHTPKKWEKNRTQCLKHTPEARTDIIVQRYLHPENFPADIPRIKDRVTLYYLLMGDYRQYAEELYMAGNAEDSFAHMYLAGAAIVKAYSYLGTDKVENPAVQYAIDCHRDLAETVYRLAATNAWDMAEEFAEAHVPLFFALMTGDDETARAFLREIPDTFPENTVKREMYFTNPIFHKAIYTALLDGDAAAMQAAMEERIRAYRKAMWDYSTVIDVCSIMQIKLAARRGIKISLDIVEIPAYYLDESHQIDRNAVRLPEADA